MALIKFLSILAAAYVLIVALMYALQRQIIYLPAGRLPSPVAVGAEGFSTVALDTDDGLRLRSWYSPPAGAGGPVILYLHGNGGNASNRLYKVRPFQDAGYGVLLVSYRGYGGNPGRPSEAGLIADGAAAVAFLRQRGVSDGRIVLLGESLGGGVAVALAATMPAGGLILEAPFSSIPSAGQRAYPFLPVRWLVKDRFDSLGRIAASRAPLLLVHGEADRVVPAAEGRILFAAAGEPKEAHFIPGAGHNDLAAHGLLDLELAFLQRLYPAQPDAATAGE